MKELYEVVNQKLDIIISVAKLIGYDYICDEWDNVKIHTFFLVEKGFI